MYRFKLIQQPLPAPHISINDRSRTLIASQFAFDELQTSVLRTKTTIKSITQVRLLDVSFRTMLLRLIIRFGRDYDDSTESRAVYRWFRKWTFLF